MNPHFRPAVCCWRCHWAAWRKDKRGRRQAQYAGECKFPMPEIEYPMWVELLEKRTIMDTMGQDCPAFKPLEKRGK